MSEQNQELGPESNPFGTQSDAVVLNQGTQGAMFSAAADATPMTSSGLTAPEVQQQAGQQQAMPSTPAINQLPNLLAKQLATRKPQEGTEQVARPRMQSLSLFTAKFLRILRDSRSDVVEISTIIRELNITKRRLSDVLNILEGSGLIERAGHSAIRWVAPFPVTSIPLLKELAEEQVIGTIVPHDNMSTTKKLQVQLHNLTSAIEREKLCVNSLVRKAHIVLPKPSDFTAESAEVNTRFYFIDAEGKSFRVCAHPSFEDINVNDDNNPKRKFQLSAECPAAPVQVQVVCKDGYIALSNSSIHGDDNHQENQAKRWKPTEEPTARDLFPVKS